MSTDKFISCSLRAAVVTAIVMLAATPILADTPPPTQGQSCDFGNTIVTVGDVATATGLSNTQSGQQLIDAADVKVAKKAPVPEPGSLAVFGAGLSALYFLRRRSRQG